MAFRTLLNRRLLIVAFLASSTTRKDGLFHNLIYTFTFFNKNSLQICKMKVFHLFSLFYKKEPKMRLFKYDFFINYFCLISSILVLKAAKRTIYENVVFHDIFSNVEKVDKLRNVKVTWKHDKLSNT